MRARTLGVGLSGIGWCASEHIYHTRFTAQTTMEACLAADLSAERGGKPVRLPLIAPRKRSLGRS